MASYSCKLPDEKTIYVVFRNIFQGVFAEIRKSKAAKKLIQTHINKPEVKQLLNVYGESAVLAKLLVLLADGVFESTARAANRFPGLFIVAPAQTATIAASKAPAPVPAPQAQTVEQVVKKTVVDGNSSSLGGDTNSPSGDSGTAKPLALPLQGACRNVEKPEDSQTSKPPERHPTESKSPAAALQVPSLFPLYLPFATGHRILVKAQAILEAACFRFASNTIPEVLAQRGWDCPEATELNVIVSQLLAHKNSLDRLEAAAASTQGLAKLSDPLTQLRHAAVHRTRVTAEVLEEYLVGAGAFAARLRDKEALLALSRIRTGVQESIAEVENNKSTLETRLRATLDDVAARRAELDRLERDAVADMLRADAAYLDFVGEKLERSVVEQTQGPSLMQSLEESLIEEYFPEPSLEPSHEKKWFFRTEEESDVGGGSVDDVPGLTDGSVTGTTIETDAPQVGCDTEEEDSYEDAMEHDTGVFFALGLPSISK
ncbi:hypothetical protein VM1G_04829 [Cytospora mali]|uniref:Uncharacterized protein n=1 Tax=Cytospora mali TaxID=578113 RepID=A0A194W007_CYTMA|nr:hypothetical protein VM1G_04829 [Valsa mali]